MFYRETGQFKTSYQADSEIFPILQDKIGVGIILLIALVGIPLFASEFFISGVMIPFLILALATLGLNLLLGYAGQLSLGSAAFMGVGAYTVNKLTTFFPEANILVLILASGFVAAAVGMLFGLPSLRIKGLYLAVATLAAQFFLEWCFIRIGWLYNYNASGAIEMPARQAFGITLTGPAADPWMRYYAVMAIVIFLTWIASNLVHGRIGRTWMMVRDMDIAAQLMGVKLYNAKLMAFGVSSYYCGVAGAMLVTLYLNAAEPSAVFSINQSFLILFMCILGGLGSLIGSFMGAAFIFILPILLRTLSHELGLPLAAKNVEDLTFMIIGGLIIFFLIVEPHGLARLWQIFKQKLRVWPFPY